MDSDLLPDAKPPGEAIDESPEKIISHAYKLDYERKTKKGIYARKKKKRGKGKKKATETKI